LNKQEEQDQKGEKKRLKDTTNPWERVVSMVEINSTQYVGQADVNRMRQAMVARKTDITKGTSKKFTM
jgi:Clathrin light chain